MEVLLRFAAEPGKAPLVAAALSELESWRRRRRPAVPLCLFFKVGIPKWVSGS